MLKHSSLTLMFVCLFVFINSTIPNAQEFIFQNFTKSLLASACELNIDAEIVDMSNRSRIAQLYETTRGIPNSISISSQIKYFNSEYFSVVLKLIILPQGESAFEFTNTLFTIASIYHQHTKFLQLEPIYLIFTYEGGSNPVELLDLKSILPFIDNFTISSNIYFLHHNFETSSSTTQIVEAYSIRALPIIQQIQVNLAETNDLMLKLRFKSSRRSNFHQGEVIAIGMDDPDYPLATKFKQTLNSSDLELESGFEVETQHYFRDSLNFKEVAIRGIGYVRQDFSGRLTGMASQVNSGEGDIAIGATEFLEYRAVGPDGITYIHPIFHTKILAYFKQPPASSVRNIYTQTFKATLWIGIGTFWLLVIGTIHIFTKLKEKHKIIYTEDMDLLDEVFVFITASMCQQGWYKSTFSTSMKIIFFFSVLFGLLSYIAYSAALVSVLSVEVVPIQIFNDLISNEFLITSDLHIPTAKVIVKDLEDKKIIQKLDEDARNIEIGDNLEKLVSTRLAIVTISDSFYPILQTRNYSEKYVCDVISFKTVSQRPLKSSCFVKRGSPLREYFNYKLLLMQERGIKHRLITHYIIGTSISCLKSETAFQDNLGLLDLFTPFALLLGACITSLIFLTIEKWQITRYENDKLSSSLPVH